MAPEKVSFTFRLDTRPMVDAMQQLGISMQELQEAYANALLEVWTTHGTKKEENTRWYELNSLWKAITWQSQ